MDVEVSSPQGPPAAAAAAAARRGGETLWTRPVVLALWALSLVPLLLFLGTPAVTRTQEARVLETARQMLGQGPRAWLLPILNGEARLRKPPLAYWMAGASFTLFGVGEFAGRLPTALCSWLMLGATYTIAARLFGGRAGALSAAALLGSYLFFRHGRLAETDAPAALFVTLAVYAFWRGVDESIEDAEPHGARHPFVWFHLGAVCTGLAFFSKGGPGLFPLLFLIALPLVRRRPGVLGRFLLSGAWVTVVVVAGWWFAYAAATLGVTQFRAELAEVAEGLDHKAWFWEYVPMLALATAPWVILVVGSLWAGWERRRRDPRVGGLFAWGLSIFVPLCVPWNKQFHYLFPLMPCLAVFVGWLADAAARGDDPKLARAVRGLLIATWVASIAAILAAPIAARAAVGSVGAESVMFAAGGVALLGLAGVVVLRAGVAEGTLSLAAAWAILLAFAVGALAPTLAPVDPRAAAAQIRGAFGGGPYVFLGGDTSLPLCFNLRQAIRRGFTADELRRIVPPGVEPVVVQQVEEPKKPGASIAPAPAPQIAPSSRVLDVGKAGQRFIVYRVRLGP